VDHVCYLNAYKINQIKMRSMRKLIVFEFSASNRVIQAPGHKDEDRDGGSGTEAGPRPESGKSYSRGVAGICHTHQ
jgi:hypothetical protein